MRKLYVVCLTCEERERLDDLVNKGRVAAHKRRQAQLLLLVDQGDSGPALKDAEAAERVGVTPRTVEKLRKRCVLEGLEAALTRRKRSRERSRVLDGDAEAQLLAMACSEPPEGRTRWTLHLLRDELTKRQVVSSVCHETVRQVLKKRGQTLASGNVVHSAQRGRGFCVRDGTGSGGVQACA